MDYLSTIVSECFVKPKSPEKHPYPYPYPYPYHLSPVDQIVISIHYIQKGLLFHNPAIKSKDFMEVWLQKLKDSLAATLHHFYPLAGRLSTSKTDNLKSCFIFVDCENSPGAGFIHAKSDLSVEDIVGSTYVPLVVQSFFDHHKAVNHDGHTMTLNFISQELKDGVFLGLSMNHAIGDGSSFWHFFNSWSEIFNSQESHVNDNNNKNLFCLENPPMLKPWFPEGYGPDYSLPFTHPDEFVSRFESPVLKERMFHFSSETIISLKSKANQECGTTMISSFQSLTAVIWRSITRARGLPNEQETSCNLTANNRSRMDPPLPLNYFGNCISGARTTSTKVSDLLGNEFGWAALKLHQAVIAQTSQKISSELDQCLRSSFILHFDRILNPTDVHMGSSPRFNKYECEFGIGKAVAIRSGYANKFDGKISAYPGREGGGSVDLEISLVPKFMEALESDHEFMSLVSPPPS